MGYDLIIVGMGSGGMVAAEFAATLDLNVCVVERDRVGGDCLWTGCVPSKALLASAKRAHQMRTAGELGIEPVEPRIDTARVFERVRAVQRSIAETDDDPERFRAMGLELRIGEPATITGPHTRPRRRGGARGQAHPALHRLAAGRAADRRARGGRLPDERERVGDRARARLARRDRRRPDRGRALAGLPPPRHDRDAPAAGRTRAAARRARARRPARRAPARRGRRAADERRRGARDDRGRAEGRARDRGRRAGALGRRGAAGRRGPPPQRRRAGARGARDRGHAARRHGRRSLAHERRPRSTPSATSPAATCSRTRPPRRA